MFILNRFCLEGVIEVDGITFTDKLVKYLRDKSNYAPGGHPTGFSYLEIEEVPEEWVGEIKKGLPDGIKKELEHFTLDVQATYCEEGFSLLPHRDLYDDDEGPPCWGNLLLYLGYDGVEGRELLYGTFNDPTVPPGTPFQWGDPNLKIVGSIQAETGHGAWISALNPDWWHGVTPLLSKPPVIAVSFGLYTC